MTTETTTPPPTLDERLAALEAKRAADDARRAAPERIRAITDELAQRQPAREALRSDHRWARRALRDSQAEDAADQAEARHRLGVCEARRPTLAKQTAECERLDAAVAAEDRARLALEAEREALQTLLAAP